jgi:hypothetical protein
MQWQSTAAAAAAVAPSQPAGLGYELLLSYLLSNYGLGIRRVVHLQDSKQQQLP